MKRVNGWECGGGNSSGKILETFGSYFSDLVHIIKIYDYCIYFYGIKYLYLNYLIEFWMKNVIIINNYINYQFISIPRSIF